MRGTFVPPPSIMRPTTDDSQSDFPDTTTVRARDAADRVLGYPVRGNGPPLVLVPGMDGTGRLFYAQEPLLAPTFRVATFSLRESAAEMDILIDDLARVVRAMTPDAQPAIICGESFGGAVSMRFAVRHPELVRGLVVINSFAHFRPQHRLNAALLGLRLIPWGTMALVRRLTAFRLHSRYTHKTELRRFHREMKFTTKEGYLNRLRILKQYDMRPHLQDIHAPTLFVASTHDHLVPAMEQAQFMLARVPNASLHVLEGHGHICLIAPGVDLAEIIATWEGAA